MARTVPFRRTLAQELQDPEFAQAYAEELQRLRIAEQLANARQARGLTQAELARRMRTSQPAVARMERGNYDGYTLRALARAAGALGHRLKVELIPVSPSRVSHTEKSGARARAARSTLKRMLKPSSARKRQQNTTRSSR